ncbi:uncharacterized protein PGTG_09870 [Puccinia graminis f. sp. tritici CRL 75-36-700-3]|uniref:Uncharacterized protein n=1 Tax=Puccinia graminis f. sp. tritici (strain CRL 75-36-700-3 / race SCCL) TaxID=418459 RepID=E3KF75_PUCGT|nr:uncharacterized protein PGTG_09870 [Puccinia graminis f. sp. tritici CRL 75-36-700-3]EFP82902.1 hypothetical protein PGTG_09870 [Puccinia graminis f. sp. tritici CRL 75-36-700-3]
MLFYPWTDFTVSKSPDGGFAPLWNYTSCLFTSMKPVRNVTYIKWVGGGRWSVDMTTFQSASIVSSQDRAPESRTRSEICIELGEIAPSGHCDASPYTNR